MVLRRAVVAACAALLLLAQAGGGQKRAAPARLRLVVVLVVDQMRADYVEKFRHHWTRGLKRLLEQGAWFRQAAYPYWNTVTCPGHATLATGTLPATHGIVLNDWWDREAGRLVNCTTDPNARNISYGAEVTGGNGPWRLEAPTLADEMRVQLTGTRVVALSVKPRSAIMLAGQRGDAVTWFTDAAGAWTTSTAYTPGPVPFVAEFIAKNPVEADLGRTWARRLPEASYLYADDAPGEKPREGWTRAFPHELRGRGAGADRLFYDRWRRSPFADAYLSRMAQAAVDALQLGRGPGTDFLGVSFSALDTAGHDFGPRSHEVQDLLVRLDETIGGLLEHLDRAVGRENYVVALTADHGVAVIPEQMAAEGVRAGRIVTTTVREKIQQALEPILGPGTHVARVVYPEVYFAPGVSETLSAHPAALRAAMEAARSLPGVVRVFRAEELRGRAGRDAVRRAASLSHFPGRSGDLSVLPRPYFILVNPTSSEPPGDATTHGTARRYDACVPLILAGAGIRPGSYANAASPADIAPTLAHLLGITLAHSDGRVLTEALVPPR